MYICIYIYIVHTRTYLCMSISIYSYSYIYSYSCIYIYIYVFMVLCHLCSSSLFVKKARHLFSSRRLVISVLVVILQEDKPLWPQHTARHCNILQNTATLHDTAREITAPPPHSHRHHPRRQPRLVCASSESSLISSPVVSNVSNVCKMGNMKNVGDVCNMSNASHAS